MAYNNFDSNSLSASASFNAPSRLSNLAAKAVIRLIVYEDYDDCNFYRWDPVIIWQFETHQPKKKKALKKKLESDLFGHPPPPWKGVKKMRDWWYDESMDILGHLVESPLRQLVIGALEKQSWTSMSEEEDILFFFLQLCMDTQIHFRKKFIKENWYSDIAQIIENLGPFPLQKLMVGNDILQENNFILSSIIQKSPNLQVLRIGQWELSNDILYCLANHCPMLQEFSIHGMEPDVFMSDEAFFKCFFKGKTALDVMECFKNNLPLEVSFVNLKFVDILFCKHTERLIVMMAYFYQNINLNSFDISCDLDKVIETFREVNVKMPFLRVYCGIKEICDDKIFSYVKHSLHLKELRLYIDEKSTGPDAVVNFNRYLEVGEKKLKDLIEGNSNTVESLAVKSHETLNISKFLLPAFGSCGNLLKCLYFVYESSHVAINTLYQLLNLCPQMEKLVIDISLDAKDSSSKAFCTTLREHPTLETLVVNVDFEWEVEFQDNGEEDEAPSSALNVIVRDVLESSPNLKNLCLPMLDKDSLGLGESFRSQSVERLQLHVEDDLNIQCLFSFLPSFPSLKLLSLQGDLNDIWAENLEALCRKGVNVTRKLQEFTNVYRWNDQKYANSHSVYVLVM